MELPIRNMQGEVVGQVQLSDQVYAAPLNADLLHQAMVYHQANQRQGSSSTKARGDVSGGGRKPWTQKHTGRARLGSIRVPQGRHGGVAFGPHPRSYRQQLPKKMRRQAIRCALSAKVREGRLIVLENLDWTEAKTKVMAALMQTLEVKSPALVIVPSPQRQLALSVRNLPRVKTLHADLLNVLDLVRYDVVVMTVDAARRAESLWSATNEQVPGTAG